MPLLYITIPRIHLIKVVLPLPLGPIKAIHSPFLQFIETLSNAVSFPNFFETLFAIIITVKISLMVDCPLNFQE